MNYISVLLTPNTYLKATIAEAQKEYVKGDFEIARSVKELEKQLRS